LGKSNPTVCIEKIINKPNHDAYMKNIKLTNVAAFILFFGIVLIEAFQNHHWMEALLFLALGAR